MFLSTSYNFISLFKAFIARKLAMLIKLNPIISQSHWYRPPLSLSDPHHLGPDFRHSIFPFIPSCRAGNHQCYHPSQIIKNIPSSRRRKIILHFISETTLLFCFLFESKDKQESNDQLTLSSDKRETDEPPLKYS